VNAGRVSPKQHCPKATPHTQQASINGKNPMMVTKGEATIVFDSEHIK